MKAIVLTAGRGTRLRPLTFTIPKHLIPIANKPIIYYVLEKIAETGIKDVGIIIGPETGDDIKEAVPDGKKWGLKISYIEQNEPLGLAHAVRISKNYIGNERFLMFLGDNLLTGNLKQFVDDFREGKTNSSVLVTEVENPSQFGVAEIDNSGKVLSIAEKPEKPKSNLAMLGIYLFDETIFEAIEAIEPSARGEYEITDAIKYLVEKHLEVKISKISGWWKDTGKLVDLLEANRLILDEELEKKIDTEKITDSEIQGRVSIGEDSEISNSVIRGPVIIGKNVKIQNTFVGPYTSIQDNSIIKNCEIEHSVILKNCKISHKDLKISDSLIGKNCSIIFNKRKPKAFHLMLGDNSLIEF